MKKKNQKTKHSNFVTMTPNVFLVFRDVWRGSCVAIAFEKNKQIQLELGRKHLRTYFTHERALIKDTH